MDLFLIHILILVWASLGTARQLVKPTADQLLSAGLLAWGNLVFTSLLLSPLHRLGQPAWFLGISTLLALLTGLWAAQLRAEPPPTANSPETGPAWANRWLIAALILTLIPLVYASIRIAWAYPPGAEDSLTYQLPRALYYLGQNSLWHFDAADLRQTHLPFNYTLLQIFALVYSPPLQCLNLFNLLAWIASGIAVYRLCRLCALGANVSLVTCWLTLTSSQILAHATATTSALPAAAALAGSLVFGLHWMRSRLTRHALLAGLAAGLATGSQLNILLFSLAVALLWAISAYRQRRTGEMSAAPRPSLAGVLMACFISSPFLLIILAGTGPGASEIFNFALRQASADAASKNWPNLLPHWQMTNPLDVLNENTAGFGLTGGLLLLSGIYCLFLQRKTAGTRLCQLFAWLGFGWILVHLFFARLSFPNSGDFLPALLLLGPCAATALAAGWNSLPAARYTLSLIMALTVLSAGWSATVYLFKNTSRPLAPLLNAALPPPALPTLPLLVDYHLAKQPRINISTDGVNESIFPFMALGHGQVFTAHHQTKPDAYNLLSRAGSSRNADYINASGTSYVLLPIPSKSTAGVEFLASRKSDLRTRDYFGIERHAGQTRSVNTNRSLLVTLYPKPQQAGPALSTRIMVAGLNSEDRTRLVVVPEYVDGSKDATPLATFHTDGEAVIFILKPFHRLLFSALDDFSGASLGIAAIPYRSTVTLPVVAIDRSQPTATNSIFVTDVVLAEKTTTFTVEGLLPVEGPFPQWDLPFIRWAREPLVRITIPRLELFARLQVSFSVRLNVRRKAAMDVLLNGQFVKRYRFEDHLAWYDETLDLAPQLGANVLEFRDAPLNHEPDWAGYLERYSDVMKHVTASRVPLEQGAREHYEIHGRAEGRVLQTIEKPEPAPDGYYFMFRNIRLEGFKKS